MELPPRQPQQQQHQQHDHYDDALPAKLRVLVDFARHQEETIITLEEVSWLHGCMRVCPSLFPLPLYFLYQIVAVASSSSHKIQLEEDEERAVNCIASLELI